MPDDNRGRGDVDDDETVVPLLTVETGLDLATVELEEHMRSNGSEPYKSRNDEFRGRSYRKRTPLPLLQIFVLSVTRLSEPVAYTQIFPVSIFLVLKIFCKSFVAILFCSLESSYADKSPLVYQSGSYNNSLGLYSDA